MPPLLPQLMWPSWEGQWSCQWCCPSVQFSRSVMSDSVWPLGSQHARPPCPPCPHQLPEFTQTHVHWVSDAIHPSHPLSSPSPPAFNLSQHQGLFKWISSSHQVAKIWELQLHHHFFQWIFRTDFLQSWRKYSGLISFRMNWLDLFAVQGTLKSLLQHHSSKASVLQCSAFSIWMSKFHIYPWLLKKKP